MQEMADIVPQPREKEQRSPCFDGECEENTNIINTAYQSMLRKGTRRAVEEYRRMRREEKQLYQRKEKDGLERAERHWKEK